jgi:hypothetical protein
MVSILIAPAWCDRLALEPGDRVDFARRRLPLGSRDDWMASRPEHITPNAHV